MSNFAQSRNIAKSFLELSDKVIRNANGSKWISDRAGIMSLTNFSGGRDGALGVPVRQDGTNVVKAPLFPSPDAALGDGNSAARCPYLDNL